MALAPPALPKKNTFQNGKLWVVFSCMAFWPEVAADFLGDIFAGIVLIIFYVAIQWFLAATDLIIAYNWRFDGAPNSPRNIRPGFDIRNRSRSKVYFLANVAYLKDGQPIAPFDNKSLWGKELKPGTVELVEAAPVSNLASLADCTGIEVHVRLQNGRMFWLKGTGPSQLQSGRIQRAAFWLRRKFEAAAVPLE
jgi:hypothetical protein